MHRLHYQIYHHSAAQILVLQSAAPHSLFRIPDSKNCDPSAVVKLILVGVVAVPLPPVTSSLVVVVLVWANMLILASRNKGRANRIILTVLPHCVRVLVAVQGHCYYTLWHP
jgi:hypothetical protein